MGKIDETNLETQQLQEKLNELDGKLCAAIEENKKLKESVGVLEHKCAAWQKQYDILLEKHKDISLHYKSANEFTFHCMDLIRDLEERLPYFSRRLLHKLRTKYSV